MFNLHLSALDSKRTWCISPEQTKEEYNLKCGEAFNTSSARLGVPSYNHAITIGKFITARWAIVPLHWNRSFRSVFPVYPVPSLFPQNNTITELSQYLECFIYSFLRAHTQKQRNKTSKQKNTLFWCLSRVRLIYQNGELPGTHNL